MENVFIQDKKQNFCSWENLGNIKEGRGFLGEEVPVIVYRLMQFTMRDVLTNDFGKEKAEHYLRESGRLAGMEFARNALDVNADFDNFVANLQKVMQQLKIGILRIEAVDAEAREIILTVGEDLDCSGLPVTGDTVCNYDEGFITGILEVYTGKFYTVREIDCWASGARTCRFKCTYKE